MRPLALTALLAVPAYAAADRLIEIPLGRKIPYRMARLEAMFDMGDTKRNRFLLGVGVTPQIDMELMTDHLDAGDRFFTFDASYNYTTPIVDLTPGISFGVKDALDKTPEGRRFYVAVTTRVGTDTDIPLEATIGFATNSQHPIFVGASVPFGEMTKLLAEHDSRKITIGGELRLSAGLAFRLLFRQDRTLMSVSLTQRF